MSGDDLRRGLSETALCWLADRTHEVREDPETIERLFPAVGRACGKAALPQPRGWRVDDAIRTLLLLELPLRGADLLAVLTRLYTHGDTAERRGILRALSVLDQDGLIGAAAIPLVEDALRSNDPGLISAALGDYASRHLGDNAFRQAVLKAVFCGSPLGDVAGLQTRTDAELVRMFADYARELDAAGRQPPADVLRILEGRR